MAFGHRRCLSALWLYYFVLNCLKFSTVQNAYNPACEAPPTAREFQGQLVPEKSRFMVFIKPKSFNQQTASLDPQTSYCLEASSAMSISLLTCNINQTTQKWFQYESKLISIEYGRSLSIDKGKTLNLKLLENTSDSWTCVSDGTNPTLFELRENASSLQYIGGDVTSSEVSLLPSESGPWGLASDSGIILKDSKRFCRTSGSNCGPPIPGIRSFLVVSRCDLSEYLHLPLQLVEQAVQTKAKLCYNGGDVVLIGCPLGYVEIGTRDKKYKESMCLGGGKWSDPKPLHCNRVYCGRPKTYPHATYAVLQGNKYLYEDMVRYVCEESYSGRSVINVCDPWGNWSGNEPDCKHACHFTLTSTSGLIKSPNYPQPYPDETHCVWNVTVTSGLKIALWFRDFFIGPGSLIPYKCRYDALYIENVPAQVQTKVAFCGSSYPSSWYSTGNSILLTFESVADKKGKGFKIEYTTWDSSMTGIPQKPARTGTYPDEEDQSNVFIGTEYAAFAIEGLYVILVSAAVLLIILMVGAHFAHKYSRRVHPADIIEDIDDDEIENRRKVAQHKMTEVYGSALNEESLPEPQAKPQPFISPSVESLRGSPLTGMAYPNMLTRRSQSLTLPIEESLPSEPKTDKVPWFSKGKFFFQSFEELKRIFRKGNPSNEERLEEPQTKTRPFTSPHVELRNPALTTRGNKLTHSQSLPLQAGEALPLGQKAEKVKWFSKGKRRNLCKDPPLQEEDTDQFVADPVVKSTLSTTEMEMLNDSPEIEAEIKATTDEMKSEHSNSETILSNKTEESINCANNDALQEPLEIFEEPMPVLPEDETF